MKEQRMGKRFIISEEMLMITGSNLPESIGGSSKSMVIKRSE